MTTQKPQILQYDITAYLGDTLTCVLTWKDALEVPVDFTGCTAAGQIKIRKKDTEAVEEFTIILGDSAGNITYSLTAAEVAALGIGNWVYDIQITFPDTSKRTYISGKLKIIQDVTRP